MNEAVPSGQLEVILLGKPHASFEKCDQLHHLVTEHFQFAVQLLCGLHLRLLATRIARGPIIRAGPAAGAVRT